MPRSRYATRRAVLQGIGAALAAGVVRPHAGFAAEDIAASPVAPDITLLTGAGGNVLVVATDAGKVLVDSGAAAASETLLATLASLPGGGAVTTLLNTHWHLDQIGSNEALGRAGATIVAHEKTRLRLATGYYLPLEDRYQLPLPEAGLPTKTTYTNDTLTVGGRRIDYGYLITAHTDGDLYVAFPERDVIAAGDVLSPVKDPVFDWFGGGWLGGRVDALAKLLTLGGPDTRYVPSIGPVVGRAEVQAEHDAMLELFERMVVHVRLGENAQDILDAGVLDGLGRSFEDPYKLVYDIHKGLWAHHNKLMPDIV